MKRVFDFYTEVKGFYLLSLFYSLWGEIVFIFKSPLNPSDWDSLCFQLTGYQVIKPETIFRLEQEKPWLLDEEILSQNFSGEK